LKKIHSEKVGAHISASADCEIHKTGASLRSRLCAPADASALPSSRPPPPLRARRRLCAPAAASALPPPLRCRRLCAAAASALPPPPLRSRRRLCAAAAAIAQTVIAPAASALPPPSSRRPSSRPPPIVQWRFVSSQNHFWRDETFRGLGFRRLKKNQPEKVGAHISASADC